MTYTWVAGTFRSMRRATTTRRSLRQRVRAVTIACLVSVAGIGATAAPAAASSTYVVRSGDSMYAIAAKFHVTANALAAANNMAFTDAIHPGDTLTIPTGPAPAAPPGNGPAGSYVVRPGDSLYAIARRHGITLQALLAANSFTAATVIVPGDGLVMPATATTPAVRTDTGTGSAGGYTIRPGDHLSGVAARHEVSLAALLDANGLTVTSVIQPGQTLIIPAAGSPSPALVPGSSAPVDALVSFLHREIGKPYQYGADGPESYDCSGLVAAAYASIGIKLPHQSGQLSTRGTAVAAGDIRAGDLIFTVGVRTGVISHVGVAVSASEWIQAVQPGEAVKRSPIPAAAKIAAVRRII